MVRLDRESAANEKEKQDLIDAGQRDLFPEGPQPKGSGDKDSDDSAITPTKTTGETVTQEGGVEKIESLNLIRDGKNFREMDENGNPNKSGPIIREIEINGEKKYISSQKDNDGSTFWYEHTEENKDSTQKGDEDSTGNTRKDLEAKLQASAGAPVAEESKEEIPAEEPAADETPEDDKKIITEGDEDAEVTGEDAEVTGDDIEDDADSEIAGDEQRINDFMDTHDETIEHMYTDKYGDDNEIISYDRFKEKLRDKWNKSDSGFDQAEDDVALGHKEMKAAQKKEEEIKAEKKQKEDEIKAEEEETEAKEAKAKKEQKKQEEAEAKKEQKAADDKQAEKDEKERIKDLEREKKEKEDSENEIAYGDTDEAIAAREEAHASSGSNLYTHFDEKTGELKHETHGEATEKTGEHKHLDDHDEKEAGSHPANHHNKEIADKSLPPAARDLREQRALGDDADESIIAESTEFLRQQAQEGYIWNANTGHWAHKESLSNLMMKNRGLNATLANGNHVGENGKSTFKDGSGKSAKGIFHLGSGYNLHQLNEGVGGKSLSRAYGQSGVLAAHIKSGNSSSQIGNAGEAYEQSGQGAPASGFGSGLAGAKTAFQVGRTQKPSQTGIGPTAGPQASALSSIRSFFGLEKAILSDSALQKLVDSYQSKNRNI